MSITPQAVYYTSVKNIKKIHTTNVIHFRIFEFKYIH